MTFLLSPRATRTRNALVAAGLDLLAERPIDAIAIDEVVEAAGVAKGSFFNHFTNKHSFADTIAFDIRRMLEDRVSHFNAGTVDPLKRLSGGMITAAIFAVDQPHRSSVLVRTSGRMTIEDHPLNRGIVCDVRDAIASQNLAQMNEQSAVLYWLGCCQTLMTAIVASKADEDQVRDMLCDMLELGLRGMGVKHKEITSLLKWATDCNVGKEIECEST